VLEEYPMGKEKALGKRNVGWDNSRKENCWLGKLLERKSFGETVVILENFIYVFCLVLL